MFLYSHTSAVCATFIFQTTPSFLSQGYKLISIEEGDNTAIANFQDLIDTTSMSRDEKRKRWIQMSQYQLVIWNLTQKSRIVENYFTVEEVNEFSCSVSGDVCNAVDTGQKDLSYIASQMSIEI